MNVQLLKKLGNIDQIAGIRQSRILHGRAQGVEMAEFYNAAGLRFTVIPDRCMDLYDLSYKGVNLCFQSKVGLVSPMDFNAMDGEFQEQWTGGAMVTCGLDNVGDHVDMDGIFPTHGRTSHVPAKTFGADTYWDGDNYVLKATGEIHQSSVFSRHLSLRRKVKTGLNDKALTICDVVTNYEAVAEPYMLLYHFNFGYPLVSENSHIAAAKSAITSPTGSDNPWSLSAPQEVCGEELYIHTQLGDRNTLALYNEELELGMYMTYDTKNLPSVVQWKCMRAHDYVVGLEPGNTYGMSRNDLIKEGKIAMLAPYSSAENTIEVGVMDSLAEIRGFLKNL